MNKFKFTEEELSRILSAHEAGDLGRLGLCYGGDICCVLQAAWGYEEYLKWAKVSAIGTKKFSVMKWFDSKYRSFWTADQFLTELEEIGVV